MQGYLGFKLDEHQEKVYHEIHESDDQETLIFCSRQWGKSFLSVTLALEYCIQNPNSIVRIAAPTLKQAKDIVADNLNPIIADAPEGLIKPLKSEYRWKVGTSELRLGTTERSNVDSLRGGNASLIICEEGGFVKSDDYKYAVRSVIAPQLLRSGGKLFHVTTPSEDPNHYIHTEVLPKCSLSGSLHKYNIYTNTALTPADIKNAMELCGGEFTDDWKREYLVQIIRSSTLTCVPEWKDDLVVDVKKIMPEYLNYNTVIDFGGVMDKTVALAVAYDFKNNKLLVLDERSFPPNTKTEDIVQEVLTMEQIWNYKPVLRYCDAPGQILVDLINVHEFNCALPQKDDWVAALNALRVEIGSGNVLVNFPCQLLAKTLEFGQFTKNKKDYERTEALGHNDALAALTYANRMIDRTTNPWPEDWHDRDSQVRIKPTEHKQDIERIAEIFSSNPNWKRRR